MSSPLIQAFAECRETALVGGKAANLGALVRAGFRVPEGFAITTEAYRRAGRAVSDAKAEMPAELAAEICRAFRALSSGENGAVAVRSSATAEDMAGASMAGQYETYLDIRGEAELLDAVRRCWGSLDSPRIRAYFAEQGIDAAGVAMAVAVQRMVAADVAGVLFTANPHKAADGTGGAGRQEMLLEASWGLGETVVSGRVQPDVLRLDATTGRVIEAVIADKEVELAAGSHEVRPVAESRRRQACLREGDVRRLWELGKRTVEHFGAPQDMEWAIQNGELFLLQSRPITTLAVADAAEKVLESTRKRLYQQKEVGHGPWVLHNLAETLPHPTPLTWSIIRTFMAGSGGFGEMYRKAGFQPAPAVEKEGFLELIAGRIYMDAARAPEMFFAGFPFAFDVENLAGSPDATQSLPTLPRGSWIARLRAGKRLKAVNAKLDSLATDFDRHLREDMFPSITKHVARAKQVDLRHESDAELVKLWQERERQVMHDMAWQLLMPSLISGKILAELRSFLAEHFWQEDADALAQAISAGGSPSRTALADAELFEVGKGKRTLDSWLAEHGHRAAGELELASPRWREVPDQLREMAARVAQGDDPIERHRQHAATINQRVEALRSKLSDATRAEFDRHLGLARRYVVFREDSKDFLILGYDLLRDLALEAGRRLGIGKDVFYLTRDELFTALVTKSAPATIIAARKSTYQAEIRLELPRVIEFQSIDKLGSPSEAPTRTGGSTAFTLSTGIATGPARILASPTDGRDLGRGYILVCTSTDTSWTPLFVNAAGLVLERGGTLSHGAVVARELGLPAVVLANATRKFKDGEELCVDGTHGWVGPASETRLSAALDSGDTRVRAEQVPPPPGAKDRKAARIRNVMAMVWAVFLLAVFILPAQWVHDPTITLMDRFLWPVVQALGRPGAVAAIAVAIAVITLLVQKLCTDNARLREAKRRATLLTKEANGLPRGSARRRTPLALAAPVQVRTLMAAMVPVGLLLGPLVMPFAWFKQRIDPAVWNARAGSAVQVVAMVESSWSAPVTIQVPESVKVDEATPVLRTLPPIRQTLEHLLALYQHPRSGDAPWELSFAPQAATQTKQLQDYLANGVPPQGITWLIRPSDDFSGRFPVTVNAGSGSITMNVVLGNDLPPGPRTQAGSTPIKEVRLVYPGSKVEPPFWQPFAGLAGEASSSVIKALARFQTGWLLLYILVYIPALYAARAILRVA